MSSHRHLSTYLDGEQGQGKYKTRDEENSIAKQGVITLSKSTFCWMTFSIKYLFETISINETQHNSIECHFAVIFFVELGAIMFNIIILNVVILSIAFLLLCRVHSCRMSSCWVSHFYFYAECHYAKCHYADSRKLNLVMLSVVMKNVVILWRSQGYFQ